VRHHDHDLPLVACAPVATKYSDEGDAPFQLRVTCSLQDHEQQEPGKPQLDRAEVFNMKLKVVRDGDTVRASEGGDQAGPTL
jgi:hypothetical protein